jgi:hypothetical protein
MTAKSEICKNTVSVQSSGKRTNETNVSDLTNGRLDFHYFLSTVVFLIRKISYLALIKRFSNGRLKKAGLGTNTLKNKRGIRG